MYSAQCKQIMRKTWKRALAWAVAAKIPFGSEIDTFDLLIFTWKYVFLKNSGAFKEFQKFFLWKRRIECLNSVLLKKKPRFYGLWRWEATLKKSKNKEKRKVSYPRCFQKCCFQKGWTVWYIPSIYVLIF